MWFQLQDMCGLVVHDYINAYNQFIQDESIFYFSLLYSLVRLFTICIINLPLILANAFNVMTLVTVTDKSPNFFENVSYLSNRTFIFY